MFFMFLSVYVCVCLCYSPGGSEELGVVQAIGRKIILSHQEYNYQILKNYVTIPSIPLYDCNAIRIDVAVSCGYDTCFAVKTCDAPV